MILDDRGILIGEISTRSISLVFAISHGLFGRPQPWGLLFSNKPDHRLPDLIVDPVAFYI